MGRAKSWNREEKIVLARAWIAASETGSDRVGVAQPLDRFWLKVVDEVAKREPIGPAKFGRYSERSVTAIQNHWRDKIQSDVNKFNSSLKLIYNSSPTGSSRQNCINMAVAVHLGKASSRQYMFREYDALQWPNYGAWLVLRGHRKFLQPAAPLSITEHEDETPAPTGEEERGTAETGTEEEGTSGTRSPPGDDGSLASTDNSSIVGASSRNSAPAPDASTIVPAISAPASGGTNRRGGKGRNAARSQQDLEEHRRKKRKAIRELTDLQKQRMQSQNKYMKFTALKWYIENTTDPNLLEKYHSKMATILDSIIDEDDEDDLPTIPPFAQTMETALQTQTQTQDDNEDEDEDDDHGGY
jgi:hypothetical protein